jgi:hypothetical protein
MTINDKEGI